jgi:hypothetical protein
LDEYEKFAAAVGAHLPALRDVARSGGSYDLRDVTLAMDTQRAALIHEAYFGPSPGVSDRRDRRDRRDREGASEGDREGHREGDREVRYRHAMFRQVSADDEGADGGDDEGEEGGDDEGEEGGDASARGGGARDCGPKRRGPSADVSKGGRPTNPGNHGYTGIKKVPNIEYTYCLKNGSLASAAAALGGEAMAAYDGLSTNRRSWFLATDKNDREVFNVMAVLHDTIAFLAMPKAELFAKNRNYPLDALMAQMEPLTRFEGATTRAEVLTAFVDSIPSIRDEVRAAADAIQVLRYTRSACVSKGMRPPTPEELAIFESFAARFGGARDAAAAAAEAGKRKRNDDGADGTDGTDGTEGEGVSDDETGDVGGGVATL